MNEREEDRPGAKNDETPADEHRRLTGKLRSLTRMATGLSHDLNNLLAAILGNNSIVLRGLPDESPWKENARQVEATALRALELTNQILIFAGKAKSTREDVNLVSLVEDMKETLRLAIARDVRIEYDLPKVLPTVLGDTTLIRQVIRNLVTNAADAMPDRKGVIHLGVGRQQCDAVRLQGGVNYHGQRPGEYVYLEVADSGCGMRHDVQECVFDPFFTTGLRRQGLGLSVVYGITEMHDGVLQIESAPDKGTRVRVLLPRERFEDDDLL